MKRVINSEIKLGLISVFVVLITWQILSGSGLVSAIFLPAPKAVFKSLFTLVYNGSFASAILVSFARILSATIIAFIIGAIIGSLMAYSKTVSHLLNPLVQPLRYLPITALLPLLILWLGIGETMKIIFLVIGILFYVIPLVKDALEQTPIELIEVVRSWGVSAHNILLQVRWPHALPRILDGLIVVNGIGWTYVILAEIINSRNGIGYLINIAGRLQKTSQVFAGLLLIALVAILCDRALLSLKKRYLFW